jgi:hypothetical protein
VVIAGSEWFPFLRLFLTYGQLNRMFFRWEKYYGEGGDFGKEKEIITFSEMGAIRN